METLLTIDALEAAARQCGRKGFVRIPFVGWVSAERLVKTCQTMGEGDARAMRRAIRRARIALGRHMRIRVHVFTEQTRHGYGGGDYAPMYEDTCEVYGWRAALTAIRAMRAEMPPGWRTLHLTDDPVLSANVREALDLPADDEPSRLCCGRYIG